MIRISFAIIIIIIITITALQSVAVSVSALTVTCSSSPLLYEDQDINDVIAVSGPCDGLNMIVRNCRRVRGITFADAFSRSNLTVSNTAFEAKNAISFNDSVSNCGVISVRDSSMFFTSSSLGEASVTFLYFAKEVSGVNDTVEVVNSTMRSPLLGSNGASQLTTAVMLAAGSYNNVRKTVLSGNNVQLYVRMISAGPTLVSAGLALTGGSADGVENITVSANNHSITLDDSFFDRVSHGVFVSSQAAFSGCGSLNINDNNIVTGKHNGLRAVTKVSIFVAALFQDFVMQFSSVKPNFVAAMTLSRNRIETTQLRANSGRVSYNVLWCGAAINDVRSLVVLDNFINITGPGVDTGTGELFQSAVVYVVAFRGPIAVCRLCSTYTHINGTYVHLGAAVRSSSGSSTYQDMQLVQFASVLENMDSVVVAHNTFRARSAVASSATTLRVNLLHFAAINNSEVIALLNDTTDIALYDDGGGNLPVPNEVWVCQIYFQTAVTGLSHVLLESNTLQVPHAKTQGSHLSIVGIHVLSGITAGTFGAISPIVSCSYNKYNVRMAVSTSGMERQLLVLNAANQINSFDVVQLLGNSIVAEFAPGAAGPCRVVVFDSSNVSMPNLRLLDVSDNNITFTGVHNITATTLSVCAIAALTITDWNEVRAHGNSIVTPSTNQTAVKSSSTQSIYIFRMGDALVPLVGGGSNISVSHNRMTVTTVSNFITNTGILYLFSMNATGGRTLDRVSLSHNVVNSSHTTAANQNINAQQFWFSEDVTARNITIAHNDVTLTLGGCVSFCGAGGTGHSTTVASFRAVTGFHTFSAVGTRLVVNFGNVNTAVLSAACFFWQTADSGIVGMAERAATITFQDIRMQILSFNRPGAGTQSIRAIHVESAHFRNFSTLRVSDVHVKVDAFTVGTGNFFVIAFHHNTASAIQGFSDIVIENISAVASSSSPLLSLLAVLPVYIVSSIVASSDSTVRISNVHAEAPSVTTSPSGTLLIRAMLAGGSLWWTCNSSSGVTAPPGAQLCRIEIANLSAAIATTGSVATDNLVLDGLTINSAAVMAGWHTVSLRNISLRAVPPTSHFIRVSSQLQINAVLLATISPGTARVLVSDVSIVVVMDSGVAISAGSWVRGVSLPLPVHAGEHILFQRISLNASVPSTGSDFGIVGVHQAQPLSGNSSSSGGGSSVLQVSDVQLVVPRLRHVGAVNSISLYIVCHDSRALISNFVEYSLSGCSIDASAFSHQLPAINSLVRFGAFYTSSSVLLGVDDSGNLITSSSIMAVRNVRFNISQTSNDNDGDSPYNVFAIFSSVLYSEVNITVANLLMENVRCFSDVRANQSMSFYSARASHFVGDQERGVYNISNTVISFTAISLQSAVYGLLFLASSVKRVKHFLLSSVQLRQISSTVSQNFAAVVNFQQTSDEIDLLDIRDTHVSLNVLSATCTAAIAVIFVQTKVTSTVNAGGINIQDSSVTVAVAGLVGSEFIGSAFLANGGGAINFRDDKNITIDNTTVSVFGTHSSGGRLAGSLISMTLGPARNCNTVQISNSRVHCNLSRTSNSGGIFCALLYTTGSVNNFRHFVITGSAVDATLRRGSQHRVSMIIGGLQQGNLTGMRTMTFDGCDLRCDLEVFGEPSCMYVEFSNNYVGWVSEDGSAFTNITFNNSGISRAQVRPLNPASAAVVAFTRLSGSVQNIHSVTIGGDSGRGGLINCTTGGDLPVAGAFFCYAVSMLWDGGLHPFPKRLLFEHITVESDLRISRGTLSDHYTETYI